MRALSANNGDGVVVGWMGVDITGGEDVVDFCFFAGGDVNDRDEILCFEMVAITTLSLNRSGVFLARVGLAFASNAGLI